MRSMICLLVLSAPALAWPKDAAWIRHFEDPITAVICQNGNLFTLSSDTVLGIDQTSGRALWRRNLQDRAVQLHWLPGGFVMASGYKRASVLNAADGKTAWTFDGFAPLVENGRVYAIYNDRLCQLDPATGAATVLNDRENLGGAQVRCANGVLYTQHDDLFRFFTPTGQPIGVARVANGYLEAVIAPVALFYRNGTMEAVHLTESQVLWQKPWQHGFPPARDGRRLILYHDYFLSSVQLETGEIAWEHRLNGGADFWGERYLLQTPNGERWVCDRQGRLTRPPKPDAEVVGWNDHSGDQSSPYLVDSSGRLYSKDGVVCPPNAYAREAHEVFRGRTNWQMVGPQRIVALGKPGQPNRLWYDAPPEVTLSCQGREPVLHLKHAAEAEVTIEGQRPKPVAADPLQDDAYITLPALKPGKYRATVRARGKVFRFDLESTERERRL